MTPAARWTLGIVGALGACVAAMVTLAVAAGSADGRRVLPDYDTRALAHGDVMAARARAAALGWRTTSGFDGDEVVVTAHDALGAPLLEASVEVSLYHRAHAADVRRLPLVAVRPGEYRATFVGLRAGIHQLDLAVRRGDDVVTSSGWAER